MSFKTSSSNIFAASSSSSQKKTAAPVKKVDPHYEDPTLRAPHEIVGTAEWGYAQYLENVRQTGVVRDFAPSTMDAYKFKSGSYTPEQLKAESELVNNILNFTAASEWAQIEDTDENGVSKENDKKWIMKGVTLAEANAKMNEKCEFGYYGGTSSDDPRDQPSY